RIWGAVRYGGGCPGVDEYAVWRRGRTLRAWKARRLGGRPRQHYRAARRVRARHGARVRGEVAVPVRRLELLRQAVPAGLLHRHLPAVLRRRAVRRESPLHRPQGRIPGADRRRHAGRGLAGQERQPGDQGPRVLRRHRGPARGLRGGGRARDRAGGRPPPACPGADGGAVPGPDPVRVHQLGPDRLRVDGAGDRRLGRPPRRVGRRPARPRGRGQVLPAGGLLAAAVVAWLAVDLPVMIIAPSGWAYFYTFSKDRGADWGSIWYLFEHFNVPVLGSIQLSALNEMSAAFFAVACAAIAVLALAAPRRPRLPQLCFLMLAAFLMTNKVWSPQY